MLELPLSETVRSCSIQNFGVVQWSGSGKEDCGMFMGDTHRRIVEIHIQPPIELNVESCLNNTVDRRLAIDYIQIGLGMAALVALIFVGFFALKLLVSLRQGMLERGWKHIAWASVFLVSAQFPYMFSGVVPPGLFTSVIDVGITLDLIGTVFLAYGLRAHYHIWKIDTNQTKATSAEAKEKIAPTTHE